MSTTLNDLKSRFFAEVIPGSKLVEKICLLADLTDLLLASLVSPVVLSTEASRTFPMLPADTLSPRALHGAGS